MVFDLGDNELKIVPKLITLITIKKTSMRRFPNLNNNEPLHLFHFLLKLI